MTSSQLRGNTLFMLALQWPVHQEIYFRVRLGEAQILEFFNHSANVFTAAADRQHHVRFGEIQRKRGANLENQMTNRAKLLGVFAAAALSLSPAFAAPGGNGNGSGQGNGGNSADGGGSQGHGAATSTAARDKTTTGVAKALSVVGTTPASPTATLSLQKVLDKLLAREDDAAEEDPDEIVEPIE